MQGKTLDYRGATVGNIMGLFPDVNGWIERLARHFYGSQSQAKNASVKDFFQKLKYNGKVEHLSMWLCFFSNRDLSRIPPAVIKKKTPELVKLMLTARARTGMWPTPMVLVTEAEEAGIF